MSTPKSRKATYSLHDERAVAEEKTLTTLDEIRYPDESELETVSDALAGGSDRNGKWEKIGTVYEGIFKGLRYQEAQNGRAFAMASLAVKTVGGAVVIEDIFLPIRAAAFFFTYEFPQNEYVRIEYIGDKPIPGRNAMKLFKIQFERRLQLKPLNVDLYSVSEMKSIFNPIKRKEPKKLASGEATRRGTDAGNIQDEE